MNDNYTQDQINIPDPLPSVIPDSVSDNDMGLSPVPDDDSVLSPGESYAESSVSSGDEAAIHGMVSSGDQETMLPDQETIEIESVILQDPSADIVPYLERINYTLTAIFWLLLFMFCFKRIRSGVKGFTGRGINE